MSQWQPTGALSRACTIGALALVGGLAVGRPLLVAVAVPFLIHTALALLLRPRSGAAHPAPEAWSELGQLTLDEGQATTSTLHVDPGRAGAGPIELVVRTIGRTAHVATDPPTGTSQTLHPQDVTDPAPLTVGATRWGRIRLAEEKVALYTGWAGFAWGPTSLGQQTLTVLPRRSRTDASTPAPHPIGLVGAHRSRRPGSGIELAGIRPFAVGDRLRRIHWPSTQRTGALQTIVSDAEEDASILLLVDGLADHGTSGGLTGAQTSLDITMRAAATIAEHHLHLGDRVGLRVIGGGGAIVPSAAGRAHVDRILGVLARVRPAAMARADEARLALRVPPGTVVVVLTPLLEQRPADLAVLAARARHDVVVVDTMPVNADPVLEETTTKAVGALAWRLRRLDREPVRAGLQAQGCAVVAWQGPQTLGRVLREIARNRSRMVGR